MPAGAEDEDKEEEKAPEYEQVNRGTALWMRNKSEIEDEEYKDFYKHISHDFDEPLAWAHNRVEGTNEYSALLFVPKRAPWDLWDREQKHGVKLYVRRVFIMDEADKLMPRLPALRQGCGGLGRPAAQCLPRAAAAQPQDRHHPPGAISSAFWCCWSPWPRTSRRTIRPSGTSSARS